MKCFITVTRFAAGFLCALALAGCGGNGAGSSGPSGETTIDRDASYAFGMNIGANMKQENIVPDIDEFMQGLKDSLTGEKTRLTGDDAQAKIQEAFMALMEQRNQSLMREETEFLAENSKKPGLVITGSGLQYEVISEGTGVKPAAADTVRVHYKGSLPDGTEFDSSYARGQPAEFPLNEVIAGWTEGIQLMGVGDKYKFYIPSALAYGPQGRDPVIPPYATLIFDVELLDIVRGESK
jgi:FKBP-type peptidyl-prolyl cis-trans isomerase